MTVSPINARRVGARVPSTLTREQRATMLLALMRDQSYQASPLGTMVGRYIRWLRNEWGATPSTVRDYEMHLAKMAQLYEHKEPYEVDVEDLRQFIDLWAHRSPRTRQKITSIIRSFWAWMEDEGHIALSPAARIRRPRAERKVARVLAPDARPRLLTVAAAPRDRLGLFCLLVLGLRRDELATLQFRDFDPARERLRVYGKGRKERNIPLRGPILAELHLALSADLPAVGRPPQPDDFLLYPIRTLAAGKGPEGQLLRRRVGSPKKKPSPQSVTRWWYRHLQDAGLVGPGVTSGMNMHRARHTFVMELRRVAGVEAASQAAGHADLSTTLGIYGHQDDTDLERAMDAYASWLNEQEG